MRKAKTVPERKQRVLQVSVRSGLVEWWDEVIEPEITKSGMSRSEFIMAAVMEYVGKKRRG